MVHGPLAPDWQFARLATKSCCYIVDTFGVEVHSVYPGRVPAADDGCRAPVLRESDEQGCSGESRCMPEILR